MKEKLYKLYFEYRHEIQPEDDEFVCICRADQVIKIQTLYKKLWREIIEPDGIYPLVKELTSDPILQSWEAFDGIILKDIKTGERFYYIETRELGFSKVVDGYKLEPIVDDEYEAKLMADEIGPWSSGGEE